MSTLNRRAFACGTILAALSALPTMAAVNASPDHELLILRSQLLQAYDAAEASAEAFAAIHEPLVEAAWLEVNREPGEVPRPGDGDKYLAAFDRLCAGREAEYNRLEGEMNAAYRRYDGIAKQIMATPARASRSRLWW
jgi:hypothetical protein